MKLSVLLAELNRAMDVHGDIEVQIQSCPDTPDEMIMNDAVFFVVLEEYEDGYFCNLRTWPY